MQAAAACALCLPLLRAHVAGRRCCLPLCCRLGSSVATSSRPKPPGGSVASPWPPSRVRAAVREKPVGGSRHLAGQQQVLPEPNATCHGRHLLGCLSASPWSPQSSSSTRCVGAPQPRRQQRTTMATLVAAFNWREGSYWHEVISPFTRHPASSRGGRTHVTGSEMH